MLSLSVQKYFAPVLLVHRQELYQPCSIEYFLQRSLLLHGPPPHQKMVQPAPLTIEDILDSKNNTLEHYVQPLSSVYSGQYMDLKTDAFTAPMYSHAYQIPPGTSFREFESTLQHPLWIIQYFFLYGYNASKRLFDCNCQCCTCACCNRGDHPYDLENLDVLIRDQNNNNNEYELLAVRFGAHRESDGMWRLANQVQFYENQNQNENDGKHVKAYVAFGSHGLYPDTGCYFSGCIYYCCQCCLDDQAIHPSTVSKAKAKPKHEANQQEIVSTSQYGFPRICCAANDYVDPEGDPWIPIQVESFDFPTQTRTETHEPFTWNDFQGGLESFQTGSTPLNHTYYNHSPESSSNHFKRLCCPCL